MQDPGGPAPDLRQRVGAQYLLQPGHRSRVAPLTQAAQGGHTICRCWGRETGEELLGGWPLGLRSLWASRARLLRCLGALGLPLLCCLGLAAGRLDPRPALEFAYANIRPGDAVLVGFFPKDNPRQVADTVETAVAAMRQASESAQSV